MNQADLLNHMRRVPVDDLHQHLNLKHPIVLPPESAAKPLSQWQMAIDDASILAQLYQALSPKRHLEIGTWQGHGTVLCLQNSPATVWTLNLREGEKDPDGQWCYSEPVDPNSLKAQPDQWANAIRTRRGEVFLQTDGLGQIGQAIYEQNLGHRVCQIYCDSTQWDTSCYPLGFFDTALIDGGHSFEVVCSDTRQTLPLIKSGGVVLWHDFCLDPTVIEQCSSVQGVHAGISHMLDELKTQCSQLFWIQPSWLLLGIKR